MQKREADAKAKKRAANAALLEHLANPKPNYVPPTK